MGIDKIVLKWLASADLAKSWDIYDVFTDKMYNLIDKMKGEGLININYNIFWIIADEIE